MTGSEPKSKQARKREFLDEMEIERRRKPDELAGTAVYLAS